MAASIEPLAVCTMIGGTGLAFETLENRHAVDAGHDEIEEHEGDRGPVRPFEQLEGLLAGIRRFAFQSRSA